MSAPPAAPPSPQAVGRFLVSSVDTLPSASFSMMAPLLTSLVRSMSVPRHTLGCGYRMLR